MALESEKMSRENNPEDQRKSVIEEVIGPLSGNPVIDLLKYFRKRWWLVLIVWGGMALGIHEINSYLEGKRSDTEEKFNPESGFNFNDLPEDRKEEELEKIERFHEREFLEENNMPPENNPPDDDSDDDETPPPPRRGIKISYA